MAFMNQDRKKRLVALAKPILKKYGLKGTFSVENHSGIRLTIRSGNIDFFNSLNEERWGHIPTGSFDVNTYYIEESFNGAAKDALVELLAALNDGNHDKSDIMTDYFNVGWWVWISIGKYNKPYIYTGGSTDG